MMKRAKTVLGEARQITLASDLVRLGARLQVLESETTLSRERLLKLYKEIVGKSPPSNVTLRKRRTPDIKSERPTKQGFCFWPTDVDGEVERRSPGQIGDG